MSISRPVTEPWVCRLLISLIIIMANNSHDLRVSHARATVACAASAFATYEVTKTWNMGSKEALTRRPPWFTPMQLPHRSRVKDSGGWRQAIISIPSERPPKSSGLWPNETVRTLRSAAGACAQDGHVKIRVQNRQGCQRQVNA
jgi:hypothetical protein